MTSNYDCVTSNYDYVTVNYDSMTGNYDSMTDNYDLLDSYSASLNSTMQRTYVNSNPYFNKGRFLLLNEI